MPSFRVRAGTHRARIAAAVLQAIAALNLLALAVEQVLETGEPMALRAMVQRLFYASVVPALLCRALWPRAKLAVENGKAVLEKRAELPLKDITAVKPWRIPLPWPGFSIDGFEYELSTGDPAAVARALGHDVAFPGAPKAHWLHHPALKFGVMGAALTFILFRLHQLISFGGLFGEWQLFGLRKWLHTLAGVAFFVFGSLALFAAVIRAIVEVVARVAPKARKGLEIAAAIAYYGAIAAALAAKLG